MGKRLLLIGGGHAHMVTLANLGSIRDAGHEVTVVGPSIHHYYSGMGPGMLGQTYTADQIRFATQQVVQKQNATFVCDRAVAIDAPNRTVALASGANLAYDVLSLNIGSQVPSRIVQGEKRDIFTVKPIETLQAAQARLLELSQEKQLRVGIVGGGPSAAEIAGNILQLLKAHNRPQPDVRLIAGRGLMHRFPRRIHRLATQLLTTKGVRILTDTRAQRVSAGRIDLDSGQALDVDMVFLALGVRPPTVIAEAGLPTGPQGGLRVNRYLQSTQYPEIFGGGDCIHFEPQPLDKVGVYAVRQNPVLYHNLCAALDGRALVPFDPGGNYLLIFNLGGGQGILHKSGLTFSGRLAFALKDWIDRRFMQKFQALESS